MHRGWKSLLAVGGVVLATGCAAPHEPQVTFYSHGNSTAVDPTLFCDPTGEECDTAEGSFGRLRVPDHAPVQISVPAEVASTPWQVVFLYRDAAGRQLDGRSAVFAPDERHAYTLTMPKDGVQLEHVEVQRFSAVLTAGANGGVNFGIGGAWVLQTHG
ncbi:DUF2771 family protein [Saccharopolyspora cebuensis]|uniref:DUF2771 family protein n=1 Tax=Saccharopolyspora cebuensis TaxID=418759 RepID=A0ABV4CK92_9PSEU